MGEASGHRGIKSETGPTGRWPSARYTGPGWLLRLLVVIALGGCAGVLGPGDDGSPTQTKEETGRSPPPDRVSGSGPASLDEAFAFLRAENVEKIPLVMAREEPPGLEFRRERLQRRFPRTPVAPGEEPELLDELRRAVESARAAGAERLGEYREAVAGLRLAEALHRRGAPSARVVATVRPALQSAREARRQVLAPPATPEPTQRARAATPVPTPTRQRRTVRVQPTPEPPRRTSRPTRTTTPTTEPSPPPRPRGPAATPTATATPNLASRHVLVLRSGDAVRVYRAVTAALTRDLPGRVTVRDLPEGRPDVPGVAHEPADLVVAVGSAAATLARKEITDRPVIFCAALNPERYRLSTANMGGVSFELSAVDQLRRIHEALPGVQRIGVIHNPQVSGAFVERAQETTSRLGIRLVPAVAWEPRDVGFVFQSLREHIDLLWMIPDPAVLTRESFEVLRVQTAKAGIPFVSYAELFAHKGALLALYPDPENVGSQCAHLATRVLAGEISPEDIGIRSPDRLRIAVNRRTERLLQMNLSAELRPDVEIH